MLGTEHPQTADYMEVWLSLYLVIIGSFINL